MDLEYTYVDSIAEMCVAQKRVTKHPSAFKHYIDRAKVLYRIRQGLLDILSFAVPHILHSNRRQVRVCCLGMSPDWSRPKCLKSLIQAIRKVQYAICT